MRFDRYTRVVLTVAARAWLDSGPSIPALRVTAAEAQARPAEY